MAIYLESLRIRFLHRLRVVDSAFQRNLIDSSVTYRAQRYALQEGLISHLWQYWCIFCRDVTMASIQGAHTTSGVITTSQCSNLSNSQIKYIAKRLANGDNMSQISSVNSLTTSRSEPTWGDIKKICLIIDGIRPVNYDKMLSGFGSAIHIKDLQICRNSCAHINPENIKNIDNIRIRYNITKFYHPSDMMFWVVPLTDDFVWRTWITEMKLVSNIVIS